MNQSQLSGSGVFQQYGQRPPGDEAEVAPVDFVRRVATTEVDVEQLYVYS